MASLFKKLLTPDNLGKVLKFVSDKKNQELFGQVLHTVKDIVPKKKKDEAKPAPQPAPQPVPQRRRPQYEDDYDSGKLLSGESLFIKNNKAEVL